MPPARASSSLDAPGEVLGVRQPGLLVEALIPLRGGVEHRVLDAALDVGHEAPEHVQVVVAEGAGEEAVGRHLVVERERADHAPLAPERRGERGAEAAGQRPGGRVAARRPAARADAGCAACRARPACRGGTASPGCARRRTRSRSGSRSAASPGPGGAARVVRLEDEDRGRRGEARHLGEIAARHQPDPRLVDRADLGGARRLRASRLACAIVVGGRGRDLEQRLAQRARRSLERSRAGLHREHADERVARDQRQRGVGRASPAGSR